MKGFDLNVLMSMIGKAVSGTVKEYCEGLVSPIEEKNKELINEVNRLKKEIEDMNEVKNKIEEENKKLADTNNKLEKEHENIIKESNEILDEKKMLVAKNNKLEKEHEALNKLNNQNKIKLAQLSKYGIIALNEEIYKIMVTEYRNERNDNNRKKKIVSNLKHIIDDNDWKIKKENIKENV